SAQSQKRPEGNVHLNRVVITGMGVVAPNAVGLAGYRMALCEGRSGLAHSQQMKDLHFGCQVAGIPPVSDELAEQCLGRAMSRNSNSPMKSSAIAAMECWQDAGLQMPALDSNADWNTAAIIGTCVGGIDTIGDFVVPETNAGRVRRLGSSAAERVMSSCMS